MKSPDASALFQIEAFGFQIDNKERLMDNG